MDGPGHDVVMLATVALGALAVVLSALLYRRNREFEHVREIGQQFDAVARTGDLTERFAPHESEGSAADLAQSANRLIELAQVQTQVSAERETVYRQLLVAMHEAMAVDSDGIQVANARFAELAGADSPADLVGRRIEDLVHPDFTAMIASCLRQHRAGEPALPRVEAEMRTGGGPAARLEFSFTAISFEGRPAVLVSAVEMAPRREAHEASRGLGSAWDTLDALAESVLTTDLDGRIVYVNQAGEQLLGKPKGDLVGRILPDVIDLKEEGEPKAVADPVRQCIAGGARVTVGRGVAVLSVNGDGERSLEITVTPTRGPTGTMSGTVVALRDVSDLRGLTRAMSYQASHDALTGLVNRREFERRLEEALDSASGGARHVLCYLDLDRFKAVNDECGHVAGDGMLREMAGIIKDAVRDSDTVGRLGGDEFAVLLAGCPLEKARQIADDIVRAVNDHRFVWKDKIFNVGVSVGLVEVTHESTSLEDLVHAADSACYVAKNQGNHVHVYSAKDEAAARQRGEILWLQLLQAALKENRFELYVQPIVAMDTVPSDTGPGLEVLLRMKDDKGVPISPPEFMKAAERYRLMPMVDRWVVQTALTALARNGIRIAPGRMLCLNLSGQTLGDAGFLEYVVDCLDRTGVAPERICFEVTENAVITNIEHARRFIGVLHGMGCHFALDDFGRGLSSFSNLKNLPLDYLKIDGYFIRNLASDHVNQEFVTAMIKLAKSLNFQVIAEQVEDMSALDSARRMGVDFVQGYQVGRPQPLQLDG